MSSIIIVCEKPDAMEHIAKALAEEQLKKRVSRQGVAYYEFLRGGVKHLAVSAVGHLFGLKQNKGTGYPVFDAEWVPTYTTKGAAFTERYFTVLENVAEQNPDADLVSACDYDNEGSLIAEKIITLIFNKKDAGRMKFSTLTKQDLRAAYEGMSEHLDFDNIKAGETRHYLDWMYGVNTSRALMAAIKKGGKRFSILSAGRVQAPTLVMLANREKEISDFKPVPYWQVELVADADGNDIEALYKDEKILEKKKAEKIVKDCKGKSATIESVESKKYSQSPPAPFNITSLQTECYRLFGYSPQQTMKIAQSLYTRAYISYPRTSSEKLPPQIGYREIIKALSNLYGPLCKMLLAKKILKPVEGKLTDAAHEAIHPTVEPPEVPLKGPEQKVYDLVCRRYLALFAEPADRESVSATIDVNGNSFLFSGQRTLSKGWMRFYGPYVRTNDMFIPELKKGQSLDAKKVELLSKETQPPARFSQASIIKEMEKRGLGTRATRSNILQTLYDRSYIEGRSIAVTDLGMKVASVIREYVPDFADESLTRKFEEEMEQIMDGKDISDNIIEDAKDAIVKICDEFRKNEEKIGKELGDAIAKTQDDTATLGPCKCGGTLKIIYNPMTKSSFVGCSNYSKCKACGFTKTACKCTCSLCGQPKGKCKCQWKEKTWTPLCSNIYPLPRVGAVYKTGKTCDKCGTPIVRVYRRGYKFDMCLDTKCETKAEWGKKKDINS